MDALAPLLTFAFVTSITPGPNNLMLASSGVVFGMRRTLPHLFGVPVGFVALLGVAGLGVGAFVARVPEAALGLKLLGTGYLVYLSWVMRHAFGTAEAAAAARPIRFLEAALFQFVNPKAWIMALTAVSSFAPALGGGLSGMLTLAAGFVLVNVPCILTWVVLGLTIRRGVADPRWRVTVSGLLIALMIYTIVAIWI